MNDRSATGGPHDDRMIADFSAGRRSGLDAVYRAYGRLLYSVARTVLADDDDAQDCVHDALLRVWQRPAFFDAERGSLRGYLLVSVRNEALTRKRNAARHLRIETRVARDEPAVYESPVNDNVDRERLARALAALPPEQRSALELAYFGGLTHVQVAERLGAPLGTVKSRIALALRKLNAVLSERGTNAV